MSWLDLPIIFSLAGLEIILSADNAVILAALAQVLPKHQRKRALFYGILGAFALRFIAIILAKWIIYMWWVQVLGGAYLITLGIKHVFTKSDHQQSDANSTKKRSFWGTVAAIELADLAFAVDSVLAAVALSSKLWVIYSGAIIGLIAMRFAATFVMRLLEIYPKLILYAYITVTWIGIKLTWQGAHIALSKVYPIPEMSHILFWSVMVLIVIAATFNARMNSKPKKSIP
jgi:YkoY family integral membrane protein